MLLLLILALADAADDGFYCHSCVSSSYRNCVWNPYTSLTKDCPGDRACATVILPDGHTFRGCSQDAECLEAGDACVLCDSFSGCNIARHPPDRLQCNICQTSSLASCAALPYPRQFEKPCVRYVPGDRCVTVFDGFDVSRRDCLSGIGEPDLARCTSGSSAECSSCTAPNCNTARVRTDDRCLQCTSNMTGCANGKRSPTSCESPSGGICYSKVNADNSLLYRGCWVDLTPAEQEDCAKRSDCARCSGEGCNAQFLPQDTLSCVQCDSRESRLCAQAQRNDSLVRLCRHHEPGDRCFTQVLNDGTTRRGCLSDSEDPPTNCAPEGSLCELCSGNDCNRRVMPDGRQSCYHCDAAHQHGCDQQDGGTALLCRSYHENDRCYTRVSQGAVSRGCVSDLEATTPCLEHRECWMCYGSNCNHLSELKLRSAGARSSLSFMVITGTLFAVSLF
ncbi:uncharacterized protein LOC131216199 [Anopheles bellator]|uniref:uncharacterized protein LOC131216199 n=1 Tax=Anopheles bellator TaxID=139047 RepID=UPI0026470772|nr:uncharacterized protein LOC131216199 [Anopheles bellator]